MKARLGLLAAALLLMGAGGFEPDLPRGLTEALQPLLQAPAALPRLSLDGPVKATGDGAILPGAALILPGGARRLALGDLRLQLHPAGDGAASVTGTFPAEVPLFDREGNPLGTVHCVHPHLQGNIDRGGRLVLRADCATLRSEDGEAEGVAVALAAGSYQVSAARLAADKVDGARLALAARIAGQSLIQTVTADQLTIRLHGRPPLLLRQVSLRADVRHLDRPTQDAVITGHSLADPAPDQDRDLQPTSLSFTGTLSPLPWAETLSALTSDQTGDQAGALLHRTGTRLRITDGNAASPSLQAHFVGIGHMTGPDSFAAKADVLLRGLDRRLSKFNWRDAGRSLATLIALKAFGTPGEDGTGPYLRYKLDYAPPQQVTVNGNNFGGLVK